MESASGGKVQRLVCEFFLDERDKLWLRRTLDCQVLVPDRKTGAGEEGEGANAQRRPRTPRHGGDAQGDGDGEREDEEAALATPSTPPLAPPLPGRRIEERVGRRQARREVAVDEAEVARILAGAGAGADGGGAR